LKLSKIIPTRKTGLEVKKEAENPNQGRRRDLRIIDRQQPHPGSSVTDVTERNSTGI
jgi:hypothetical protein